MLFCLHCADCQFLLGSNSLSLQHFFFSTFPPLHVTLLYNIRSTFSPPALHSPALRTCSCVCVLKCKTVVLLWHRLIHCIITTWNFKRNTVCSYTYHLPELFKSGIFSVFRVLCTAHYWLHTRYVCSHCFQKILWVTCTNHGEECAFLLCYLDLVKM